MPLFPYPIIQAAVTTGVAAGIAAYQMTGADRAFLAAWGSPSAAAGF